MNSLQRLKQLVRGKPAPRPLLSVIVIVHNMRREGMRTLQSLAAEYQRDIAANEYEVIVVENGSSEPLQRSDVTKLGKQFSYHRLHKKSLSPARAINEGVNKARGTYIGIVIDGACMLTPGALHMALAVFKMFDNPVVMTRYFFLGPGPQNETIQQGYSKQIEDDLLAQIAWPKDGYQLFEIGSPLPTKTDRPTWFDRMFESCCLFMQKSTFDAIGGCDERFDLPGGGFLAPDLFRRAAMRDGVDIVQLIGEAVFHQLHGGTTTNTSPEDREAKLTRFQAQYQDLRGEEFSMPPKRPFYFGHMPNMLAAAKLNGKPAKAAA